MVLCRFLSTNLYPTILFKLFLPNSLHKADVSAQTLFQQLRRPLSDMNVISRTPIVLIALTVLVFFLGALPVDMLSQIGRNFEMKTPCRVRRSRGAM